MKSGKAFKLSTILPFFFFCGFILFFSIHLQGATFTVNTTADTKDANPGDGNAADADGNCSLRAAIMEANALAGPDTIEIPAGTYKLRISGSNEDDCKKGDLDIRSDLVIEGAGKTLTVIDGNDLDRVFHIKGNWNVVITIMTIRSGKTPDGDNPTAGPGGHGGGILNYKGTLTIKYCKISENVTGKGGYNSVAGGGHGGDGGGICNNKGTVTIHESDFIENKTGDGGDTATGWGGDGGGISNYLGTMTLNRCTVKKNTTGTGGWEMGRGGDGGGINNDEGALTLEYCNILLNECGDGGGWIAGGGGDGGGIDNWKGTLVIKYCTIRLNKAGDSIFDGTGGDGGGICIVGPTASAKIYQSLIAENTAGIPVEMDTGFGGGIYNQGTLSVFNSTICKNSTQPFWTSGGGIFNLGETVLESCTITENTAIDYGGGICNGYPFLPGSETIKVHNTIIADNTAFLGSPDCSGEIFSRGYNLIRTPTGCTIVGVATGNILWTNPLLGLLANNGGPTQTYALHATSPCLDTGDLNDYETIDQRGIYRPKEGDGDTVLEPDIGAFEKFTLSITIIWPQYGSTVWGTIEIRVKANTRNVDFFIDNEKIHTDDSEPFSCTWDTSTYSNGRHTIKAKGYDTSDGYSGWDSAKVSVNNTVINLEASRQVENAWLIRRQYGKITFTITQTGSSKPAKYVIERKEANGSFNSIAEVPASGVQGSSHTYNDCFLSRDITYTYRVTAYNSSGVKVGQSEEKTI